MGLVLVDLGKLEGDDVALWVGNIGRTGTGIPGTATGMLPKMIPTRIPIKIVAMFGASRRFTELPMSSATRFTLSSGPTTMILSP